MPPRKSLAQRDIALRSKGSFRGTIINPLNNRELHYESVLERDAAYIFMTDPRVVEVREQVGPVTYVLDGRQSRHFFDFGVQLKDGSTHLVAIKYERDVEKSGILDVLTRVRNGFANRSGYSVHLRTDRHITRVRAENARLVFAANREAAQADVDTLVNTIGAFDGVMTAKALLAVAGLEMAKGFWALAYVFGQGLIACVDGGLLTHSSRLRAVRTAAVDGGAQ